MGGYSIAVRISLGLAFVTLSALLLSYMLGLLPDTYRATHHGRQSLVEAVAVSSSLAVQKRDTGMMQYVLSALIERNSDVVSAAVRERSGKILAEVGGHEKHWQPEKIGDSSLVAVKFTLYEGQQIWGDVEVQFRPIDEMPGYARFLGSVVDLATYRIIQAIVFIGVIAFIGYVFYMRQILKYLDPSAVIPKRVQEMLNTLSEGVVILDNGGQIVLANASFSKTVGIASAKLVGVWAGGFDWVLTDQEGKPPDAPVKYPWDTVIADAKSVVRNVGIRLTGLSGGIRSFNVNATPIMGNDKKARGVMVTFDDMTTLERKNGRLRRALGVLRQSQADIKEQNLKLQLLATRDSLTGCLNRRAFMEAFNTTWANTERHQHALSVVMVDIDHFKSVNDKYGHMQGDEVLKGVAELLKTSCREGDYVCRYGGEEFCILLPFGGVEEATITAERCRKAIAAEPIGGIRVTISLGVSSHGLGATDPQALIHQADQALYGAKGGGRNRVVHWNQMPIAAAV